MRTEGQKFIKITVIQSPFPLNPKPKSSNNRSRFYKCSNPMSMKKSVKKRGHKKISYETKISVPKNQQGGPRQVKKFKKFFLSEMTEIYISYDLKTWF